MNQPNQQNNGGAKKRVLIIDDERAFTRLVKLNLEKTGEFEVEEQNDALKAVRSVQEFKPDLILLDVIMPDMDGGGIEASLKSDPNLCHIPVLYLTATLSQRETGVHGKLSGGALFLGKPVKMETLLFCIKENLNRSAGAWQFSAIK